MKEKQTIYPNSYLGRSHIFTSQSPMNLKTCEVWQIFEISFSPFVYGFFKQNIGKTNDPEKGKPGGP
ncbi:hypothetical protein AKJ41_05880 [candidate division MSBL1 archaeon SCGC-AAA259O05]|uniref:Transposase n=1 Tax=candidate division MSBL1 archaeon SCGC-AAA259O05 TaxID=1698271 RepID=A0A133UY74_9EURY|nr:hypothetical protein AKJ41_05880 [candidate division MSBL1 archaeon SCGC-AAA259O05]